jgi:hypothetical protein
MRSTTRLLTALFFSAACVVSATASPVAPPDLGKISGTVATDTGTKVAGASVFLVDSGGNTVASTTTNSKGRFGFSDVGPGNYTVSSAAFINGAIYGGSTPVTVTANGHAQVLVTLSIIAFP